MEEGYEVSIDYVGEAVSTPKDCYRARQQYFQIINYYKNEKIDISIKPSQLGLHIHPALALVNLSKIAKVAAVRGHTLRLDMEDSSCTTLTRNLALYLNKRFDNVGVAIQANLHRTPQDLDVLIKHRVSVRLVKGAYKENTRKALQKPSDVKEAFWDYARQLLYSYRPAIATHDEDLLEDIAMLSPTEKWEYEFLYGIRRDLQKKFLNAKYTVRIYVPFGKEWLPYTTRRLKEWKNLKFVVVNVIKEWFNF